MPDGCDLAVLDAVDEALLVLGESGRERVYYRLEVNHRIKREEIPDRPEDFYEALVDMFGEGAKIFGKIIAKNLYGRLGLTFNEHENWTLVDYVNDVKKTLEVGRF